MCCFGFLSVLNPFHRRKNRKSKPESFLTPFEIEMLPMLLKEVHSNNSRFYEVVCFRWTSEAIQSELIDPSDNSSPPTFEKEGLALRLLINKLARCLQEKGFSDEESDQRIGTFRSHRLEKVSRHSKPDKRKTVAASAAKELQTHADRTTTVKILDRDASNSLRIPELVKSRRRFTMSSRSNTNAAADTMFLLLGEILVRQFQSLVSGEDGNVHERELKLIVWKHFVQTLVALFLDKERFAKTTTTR